MTELRYIKWSKLIKDLLSRDCLELLVKGRSLQWFFSVGLRKQNMMVVSLDKVDPFTITYKDCTFKVDVLNYTSIFSIYKDYPIDQIRKGDIVLDLGAAIGAFSIPAAKRAKKVYAVEPIFATLLRENIAQNRIENIEVLEVGMGENGIETFEFMGISKEGQSVTFRELKDKIGRIDFLKIDIEGNEWLINPEDFEGIRIVTGEGHIWTSKQRKTCNWNKWKDWFEKNKYSLEFNEVKGISIEFTATKS